jgi:sugar phosphate isomerase/epimerase
MPFNISLAEWSLHRALWNKEVDHLDFAAIAKNNFGIDGIEYVNSFFFEKAKDTAYLDEMKKRADDLGVKSLLIMCDREGNLGDPNKTKRTEAVENHYKWAEAAKYLGCHSIRVNARSEGSWDNQIELAADGLRRLTEFGDTIGINTIVENHGGLSSNGKWLSAVMDKVDHPRVGTLPDFGNFRIEGDEWYDRYQGMKELMPYAKAVSAKSHEFDDNGDETGSDFYRIMDIVLDADYNGYVGIEYEGSVHSEMEGIRFTNELLKKIRDSI